MSENAIKKLFKGCKVMSVDVIDNILHVFWVLTKFKGKARYVFDLSAYALKASREERKRVACMMSTLETMITEETHLEPRAIPVYGKRS